MTGRCWLSSVQVMERPATTRLPIASKYPGAKLLKRQSGDKVPSGTGNSSRFRTLPLSSPSIVIDEESPTAITPGTCASRSAMLSCVRDALCGSLMRPSGIAMRKVCTSSGRVKPGFTSRKAMNVRIIRPETISSIRASATWPTTSALRARCRPGPSLEDRPPSLSAETPGAPNFRTAKRPNTIPLATEMARVKNNTVGSRPISSTRGSSTGAIRRSRAMPACASNRLSAPPPSASTTLSDSSARARRPRLAPRAARIASSCWRASARTRNRFATFPHAMTSTTPTAAKRIQRMSLMFPTT